MRPTQEGHERPSIRAPRPRDRALRAVQAKPAGLGLPETITACLFDLDGVLTQTAKVHAAAWKEMFDAYLRQRSQRTGEPFVPFDPVTDYDEYVDGRPRADGARAFLASRGITLPEGGPSDPPDAETVHGLSNRKNELVLERLREGHVAVYPGSVRYVQAVRAAGLHRGVVSASANTHQVLEAASLADAFDVCIDGVVAAREHLRGKPAPDTYLAAARRLSVRPEQAAVFEDALAGVAAGRAGGFGLVVGVDRVGQAEALRQHGADVVVGDLAELLEGP
jgi:beta-phosphoglucomutase family hydrolase